MHHDFLKLSCTVVAGTENKLDRVVIRGEVAKQLTLGSSPGVLTALRPYVPSGAPWMVTAPAAEDSALLRVDAFGVDPVEPGDAAATGKLMLIQPDGNQIIINYTLNVTFLPSKFFLPVYAEQLKSAGLKREQLENAPLELTGGTQGAAQWKTRQSKFGILYTPQGDPREAKFSDASFRLDSPGVTISIRKLGNTHVADLKMDSENPSAGSVP